MKQGDHIVKGRGFLETRRPHTKRSGILGNKETTY